MINSIKCSFQTKKNATSAIVHLDVLSSYEVGLSHKYGKPERKPIWWFVIV